MKNEQRPDILVVGAGLGGVAAALAAARLEMHVILTEETDWIGGQLTTQAVPPDEHPWIEGTGCTATYQRLRRAIRDYYRRNYPLLPDARFDPQLNPGLGRVSPLCHEPRVALFAMYELLAPYLSAGCIAIKLRWKPIQAHVDGDRVRAVTFRDAAGAEHTITAAYILDATELGDLLELANVEHVIGAESQAQTGEPHALAGKPDPLDQQAVTACFAMDYHPDEDFTIERPADYDFWRGYRADFWPGPQLGWVFVDPVTLDVRRQAVFEEPGREDLWTFRRILYRDHFPPSKIESDITLVNWPQNDYWLGPLVGVSPRERAANERGARQLSLSFLYWMQTEAPRHDGGLGYRGLRMRNDIVGTHDGTAKHVYVRESRRIQAERTVLEQHVAVEARGELKGAEQFLDSVGIGSYRIDLHPSTRGRTYVDLSSWPFQIPLGALIPVRVENLLPAAKNLGVTHITNGCYRLHPVEWNIGEAAGALAAFCLRTGASPRGVRSDARRLAEFQNLLQNVLGIPLVWPNPRATIR
ncbi:MAG: FAD-dependent oxidoreductase [Kofleriaceae bacterium]|nr:FAD-dependent oxidoreductase [Kofleriaceae bacterium]